MPRRVIFGATKTICLTVVFSGVESSRSSVLFGATLLFTVARYSFETILRFVDSLQYKFIYNVENLEKPKNPYADWISTCTITTLLKLGPRVTKTSTKKSWLLPAGSQCRREPFEIRQKGSLGEMAKSPFTSAEPGLLKTSSSLSCSVQSFSKRRSATIHSEGTSLRIGKTWIFCYFEARLFHFYVE